MAKRREHVHVLTETNRIEAFSDAVFAFAATLLVADLEVPLDLAVPGARGLWLALVANGPAYLAFALSFAIVVIFWGNHHQMFKHIRHADAPLLVLNSFVLMGIAFVPHVTALLADCLLDPGRATTATAMYASTLFAVSLGVNLVWLHARRHPDLLVTNLHASAIRFHTHHYRVSLALRALSVVLAFINVPACLVLLLLVSLYYLVPRG